MTMSEKICIIAGQKFPREVSVGGGISAGKRPFHRALHVLHADGFQASRSRFLEFYQGAGVLLMPCPGRLVG